MTLRGRADPTSFHVVEVLRVVDSERRGNPVGPRTDAGAAPATVSGERIAIRATGPKGVREGRRSVVTREPGDLPRL